MAKRQRLTVPYKLYNLKPVSTIKSLLGKDIKITSIKTNDIVLYDDTVIVDVEYSDIPIPGALIFYIPIKQFKPIIPDSTTYVITVNGCSVKVQLRTNIRFKEIIPLRINKVMANNTVDNEQVDQQFPYFGVVVKSPLSYFCTIIKYPNTHYLLYEPISIEKIYPEGFVPSKTIDTDKIIGSYLSCIRNISSLNFITDIVAASSLEKCTEYTKGYLIDWKFLKDSELLKGIILVQPERLPYLVVFIPSQSYRIDKDELASINRFLDMEYINYMNYEYIVK
jgi:hypothetical protein